MLKCRTDCLPDNKPVLPQHFLKCQYFCKTGTVLVHRAIFFSINRSEQSDIFWALVKIHLAALWHLTQLTVWKPLEVYYLLISFFFWVCYDHAVRKTQLKHSKCSLQLKCSNCWILTPLKTEQGKWFFQTVQTNVSWTCISSLAGGFTCWEEKCNLRHTVVACFRVPKASSSGMLWVLQRHLKTMRNGFTCHLWKSNPVWRPRGKICIFFEPIL